MSGRLRILLVGRHYWPHGSIDSAGFLYQLAIGLHRRGVHVEVLSPRYASSWPEEIMLREIPVHRPAVAPRSDWTMSRYLRQVTGWLRERGRSYDVMLADSIREESTAVVEAGRMTGCATVLRFGGWGKYGDWSWWQHSRAAKRCATVGKTADAVISKCAASHRALLAEGYSPSRIHRIDQGFLPSNAPTELTRRAARQTLAAVNRDLITADETTVAVCCGRMAPQSGIKMLADSARNLVTRYPNLKLWLIGDGPDRESIHQAIRGDGVRSAVAMPGSFCDLEDIYAAADIFVQADDDGLDHFLPSAVSAALPIVALDNESTRSVIMGSTPQSTSSIEAAALLNWFVPDSSASMRATLRQVLDDLDFHRQRAGLLRKNRLRSRPQSESIEDYLSLVQRLREPTSSRDLPRQSNRPGRPLAGDSSIEAAS